MDALTEQVVEEVGGTGRYQITHVFMIFLLSRIFYFWPYIALIFTGYYNDHHCKIPHNGTIEDWIPLTEDGRLESCSQFVSTDSNDTVACQNGFEFDPNGFDPTHGTIVMEWDLVCDKAYVVGLYVSLLNLGMLCGNFVGGSISDRIGRRKTFIANLLLVTMVSASLSASPNAIFFGAVTFIEGIFVAGSYVQSLVMCSEILSKRDAAIALPLGGSLGSIAHLLLLLLAYFVRHWRYFQLASALLPLLMLPYFKFCPESLAWLVSQGRFDEADKMLSSIARANGQTYKQGRLDALKAEDEAEKALIEIEGHTPEGEEPSKEEVAKPSLTEVFVRMVSLPRCRLYMAGQCVHQFNCAMLNICLLFMTGKLYGDFYINSLISASFGLIPKLTAGPIIRKIGCRNFMLSCYTIIIVCATMSLICTFSGLPSFVSTVLLLLARFGEAGGYQGSNVYMQEMLPVVIRSTMTNIAVGFGCMGCITGAYVGITLMQIEASLTVIALGVLSLSGLVFTFLLPDTRGRSTPQTPEEIEAWESDNQSK